MTTKEAYRYTFKDEYLNWFAVKLASNRHSPILREQGIPLDELYIGYRMEDNGFVIGYKISDSSILDVNLLATWWCGKIRPITIKDLELLSRLNLCESFQPISNKNGKH